MQIIQLLAIVGIFLGVRCFLKMILGYDLLNIIPEINNSITLGALLN
jgi:hypothetical protein